MATATPRPPADLGARGKTLWKRLLALHPLMPEPDRDTAVQACRTADLLDRLDVIVRTSEPMVEDDRGGLKTHPAVVEQRQQSLTLSRLLAALRLPDEKTGDKPQRRQVRGVQKPSAAVPDEVADMRSRLAGLGG